VPLPRSRPPTANTCWSAPTAPVPPTGLLDWLTEQGSKRGRTIEYSVGFAVTGKVRDAIATLPKTVWTAAVDADGEVHEGVDVAEITALMDLSGRVCKSVGDQAAVGWARLGVWACWCRSSLSRRSARSVVVNFHLKGRADAL